MVVCCRNFMLLLVPYFVLTFKLVLFFFLLFVVSIALPSSHSPVHAVLVPRSSQVSF